MSVESFINRVKQRDTAVYWPVSGTLSEGTVAYEIPVEIKVVWREDQRIVKDFYEHKEILNSANQGILQLNKIEGIF